MIPTIWRERRADLCELEATLAYVPSPRAARQGYIVRLSSITVKKKKKKKKKKDRLEGG